jgi:transketolase
MQTLSATPDYETLSAHFAHWTKTGHLIDQCIDLMLNLRQSGHPGGSRSKVPMLVATTLGVMRWDVRRPELAYGDRFVLVAGHANPAVYAMLAVYNEALRIRFEQTGDEKYLVPNAGERQLVWEDLLTLRHRGGLAGHAEMEGKTLFFKFNTGPSGHGAPAALGEALALAHAGAGDVRVFAMEGEGGHTAGCHHEVKNSAYGLGLDNLIYLMDWNDHGIDKFANSEVSCGGPAEWFAPYGWRTAGTEDGENYEELTRALLAVVADPSTEKRPGMVWAKTRKGRGYYIYDALSHGKSHGRNSEGFWQCRKDFQDIYGVEFDGFGDTNDPGEEATREMTRNWLQTVLGVLRDDPDLVHYLADRLVEVGDSVPRAPKKQRTITGTNMAQDRSWLALDQLPRGLFLKPGEKAANKDGFQKFGAWVNSRAKAEMGRPLVLACSADLADSTAISGFAADFEGAPGPGWYDRNKNVEGALMPQQITEFTNSGLVVGAATVNMSATPEETFEGFWGACSTYGSFSYLKYGMMRLFSQLAQDCPLEVGKVIWVAGHSGPETCEDSRTHFGVFSPGVTQLFPEGSVINLYPWEHNEVAPALCAALRTDVPIICLHLTRPGIKIPDRQRLGVPSHFEAARGAYVIREADPKRPKQGTIIVQGTSTTDSIFELLPRFEDGSAPNVRIVAAISWELFQLQDREWRDRVLSRHDWLDSTVLTNGARRLMHDWLPHKVAEHYAMSSDRDNRWRTGGNYDEVKQEAQIDAASVLAGIETFAENRDKRLRLLGHPG